MFNCSSSSQLRGRHLSTVSAELTHCGTTHINGSGTCATQTHWLFMTKSNIKHSYENDSSVTIPKSGSPVTTSASTTGKSSNTKEENSHKYITVIVACLTVAFLACSVLLTIKKRLCCKWHNRREAAGIGADRPAINSHQIVPPIENNVCNETVAEGSNPRQPVPHQIALPIENTVNQCTSTQGMDDEDSVPPGENQSTPSPENSENHSAVELYHETVAVSEQCVEVDPLRGLEADALSYFQYALGRPQVTELVINNNPFHCDCDLSWLITKMACLQASEGLWNDPPSPYQTTEHRRWHFSHQRFANQYHTGPIIGERTVHEP
ncbi:hypothetical protein Bbelb_085380 [Branchiostoma belcheri]|nr:hypothetical protein Bbelb_085380 [Branchiostoma belcheri]